MSSAVFGQKQRSMPATDTIPSIRTLELNPRFVNRIDTVWQYSGICKVLKVSKYVRPTGSLASGQASKAFITAHGNISYDFLYRSYADTPYYQRNFRQHTIQTSMNLLVKDKYAFRVNMAVRISNSPFFKNFFNGGLQLDQQAMLARLKQSAESRLMELAMQKPELQLIEASLKDLLEKYNTAQYFISRPNLAQLLIEEREKKYYGKTLPKMPKAEMPDSLEYPVGQYITDKKLELDSLKNKMSVLLQKADSLKSILYKELALVKQKIGKAKNALELDKVMVDNNIPQGKAGKWEKSMAGIKSIGIGRSILNYSELTVSNVSVTGINIEYNPRVYLAFGAGKVDYGFRDFMGRNKSSNKQSLITGRLGLGDKDHMAIILSVYTGKKYNYGSVLNDSVNGYVNVTGYSLEGTLKKNENVGVTVEVAKSTRPVTGRLTDNNEKKSLFRFSDQSNQAISIKGQTIISETQTRLSGLFRKSGENFQSFSLFTYNTDQTAWLIKADQSFLQNKVGLTAMLRRNDFTNPFTEKTFKTSTVFASGQLNVRIPKWPTLGVGYYPGSQLYIIDRERVRENVYYILNGSVIHSYSLLGVRMMSSAIYNYYSNKGTDSGFVNYSGTNYMFSHALLFRKYQLNGIFSSTNQQELKFFTLEGNVDYFPVSFFKIGVGGKYNRTEFGDVYWGGKGQVMLEIKKLGGLQLQYEKSYLPTTRQTLFPVDMGRVSWFKYF